MIGVNHDSRIARYHNLATAKADRIRFSEPLLTIRVNLLHPVLRTDVTSCVHPARFDAVTRHVSAIT